LLVISLKPIMLLTYFALFLFIAQSLAQNHPWIGQTKDTNWMNHHDNLLKQTMEHRDDIKVVFLGDSITFAWLNSGKELWNKYYVPRHAYNYGVGGERTENVIWRIENKEFDGVKAKVVVLKIGK
jgi:beta-glucosidase